MLPRFIRTIAVCGAIYGLFAFASSAPAQEHPHRIPVIVAPADNATVTNPVTVSFDFVSPDGDQGGSGYGPPGGGGGGWGGGGEHHGPHVVLVIDAALPNPGDAVPADAQHVPFPEGQRQVTVTLARGQHQLQLVLIGREGTVSRHFHPGSPVTVTVQ